MLSKAFNCKKHTFQGEKTKYAVETATQIILYRPKIKFKLIN